MKVDVNRKNELRELIKYLCGLSAIYYEYRQMLPSIKIVPKTGLVIFVEKSRKLDIVEYQISDWNFERDWGIILSFNDDENYKMCEAHMYKDENCWSIMKLR